MCNNANTCTRTTDTLSFWAGQQETALYAPEAGVDAQLWYTLAPALEMFLEDEWDGDYPYAVVRVHSVVRTGPGTYRVTATEGAQLRYESRPATTFLLECDKDGSAYMQYASDLA